MNETARRKLLEIIAKHGHSIIENPRRLEGLLRDYCGEYRREVSVLVMAVEEHAVLDLLAANSSLPLKVLLSRLTQRLCDNLGLSESAARWSIESWALALGLLSESEIKTDTAVTQVVENAVAAQTQTAATSIVTPPVISNKPASKSSYIVSLTGNGDFTSISQALKSVAPNSRLTVREGIYNESIILDKNIEIIGDGAIEKTIIRSVNSSPLVMQTDKALIRGLTFEGRGRQSGNAFFTVQIPSGELILENCSITSDTLSGVAVFGSNANPAIKNCRIYNCADSGFYIFDNARAMIENCDIFQNVNVSVAVTTGANPTIKNCRISEGKNGGVVVWGNGATGLIENCSIFGHRLANVGVREFANPVFRRCKIYDGHDTGVFVQQNGFGTFEECEIYQNSKAEIVVSELANAIFKRCNVHNGENSGVIVQNRSRALIENSNIYENSDAGVEVNGKSELVIRASNINGNQTVALRIKEQSSAKVENCDLTNNLMGAWETEAGVIVKNTNNRED